MLKRVRLRLLVLAFGVCAAGVPAAGATPLTLQSPSVSGINAHASKPFAFQPITVKRINVPASITSVGWPVFTHDGQHLLFYSTGSGTVGGTTGTGATAQLWIVGLDGSAPHCLTCGLLNDPTSQGEGETTPFSDGKRVFFGSFFQPGHSSYAVLECTPSVVDCKSSKILPVDFTAAEPATIAPGGPVLTPQGNAGGAYGAKLSQDGRHIGFSDIRADSIEMMVVGSLTRTPNSYLVADPRVINPATPTSASDPNVASWSDAGALYEFKTFTNGGADATYVEVGGVALGNPDVWSVNLASGKRTRLTGHPDYEEDNAGSPDGSLLAMWSNKTMHMADWFGGLIPVRDFIDAPSSLQALAFSSSNKRCHGPVWLMPGTGDAGGTLAGQPIIDDRVPHIFVSNNLTGWPQWSPNGTMLALNATDDRTPNGYPAHSPFLLVAQLGARTPTTPLPAVSSQPGAWAGTPNDYHPVFAYAGTKTFAGTGGGTVDVDYGPGSGVLQGKWSETYKHYSDDGRSFVDGTVSILESGAQQGTYSSHLKMSGAHTGSDDIDFNSTGKTFGTSTLDGHTVSGPSPEQDAKGACPHVYPKKPPLAVTSAPLDKNGNYQLHVTSSIRSMGPNEALTSVSPVENATITYNGTRVHTDRLGYANIRADHGGTATVRAGDTLRPTTLALSGPATTRGDHSVMGGPAARATDGSAPHGSLAVTGTGPALPATAALALTSGLILRRKRNRISNRSRPT